MPGTDKRRDQASQTAHEILPPEMGIRLGCNFIEQRKQIANAILEARTRRYVMVGWMGEAPGKYPVFTTSPEQAEAWERSGIEVRSIFAERRDPSEQVK